MLSLPTSKEDERFLYDTVTDAQGCPQYPVKTWNVWSIDDSFSDTFAGVATKADKSKLVTKKSVKASGTEAVWQLDESNSMSGMRVALTIALSGAGTYLPIVVCFSGLTEHELPDMDFLEIEIPGFCIGGGSNISNKNPGYLIL